MTDLSQPASVTEGSQTITSTSESTEQIRESMQPEPEPEPEPEEEEERPPVPRKVSKAAAELGKRGGEASAEARKAARESAEDDEPDAVAEAERLEKEGKLGKPRHDPKARMLAATREAKAAREERDAARAEAEAARRERDAHKAQIEAAKTPKQTEKAQEVTGKPIQADFATYDEWVEAVADWKADRKLEGYRAQIAQEAQVKEYASHIDTELGKAIAARKEYEKIDPAFLSKVSDEVREIANRPSFARNPEEKLGPQHVIADEIILAGPAGPRVMLHLSDNPAEVQRLMTLLTPQDIQVEMRILAKTLNGAATTAISPRKEVSKAPQPIRPVTGGPHIDGDSDDLDDEAPLSAYVKRWNRREASSTR